MCIRDSGKSDNNSEFLTYHSERQVRCGCVYISQLAVSYSESEKTAADGIYAVSYTHLDVYKRQTP